MAPIIVSPPTRVKVTIAHAIIAVAGLLKDRPGR
jgi:hypothetical protein